MDISREGKWRDWIDFFLEGVVEQSNDAIQRKNRLLGLCQDYRNKLQEARSSALLLQLVDRLYETPVLNIPTAATFLKVTHRSAAKLIGKLIDANIITEVTKRERYRLYAALDIISTIESSQEQKSDTRKKNTRG
jgi:Fic family protein